MNSGDEERKGMKNVSEVKVDCCYLSSTLVRHFVRDGQSSVAVHLFYV